MLVTVTTEIPTVVTSKQWFIIIGFKEEIQKQDEKLCNSTKKCNTYIRLCVNEYNMIYLFISTYFSPDLSTTIPVVYPIYDFSNLERQNGMVSIIFVVETFQDIILELSRWLEKIGRIRWNMKILFFGWDPLKASKPEDYTCRTSRWFYKC